MALELQGIGERLRRAGYSVGKILSDTADSWEREGRIPHNLTDAYRPHEREDLWKVWRTIIAGDKDFKYQLGSGEIGSNIRSPLILHIDCDAEKMIESEDFVTLKCPKEVQIVRSTIHGLGFIECPTTDRLLQRIVDDPELDLLPPEAAVALRLNYKDQPLGEYCYVAMKPIVVFAPGRDGRCIFGLSHSNWNHEDQGLLLDSVSCPINRHWGPNDEFILCLRK